MLLALGHGSLCSLGKTCECALLPQLHSSAGPGDRLLQGSLCCCSLWSLHQAAAIQEGEKYTHTGTSYSCRLPAGSGLSPRCFKTPSLLLQPSRYAVEFGFT
ncbi:unnamed protein product [Caretta caretta]